jgi:threonine synthase
MKMGIPVNKLICASNANNVLTEFIKTGEYNKNREFYTTVSPSMDILISSNLERLLFDLSGNDDKKVSKWMSDLAKDGKYTVTADIKKKLSKLFWAGCCDDYFTKVCIYNTNQEFNYTVDTHTAVAVDVYNQYKTETGDETPAVIVSTASPFKFNQSVLSALGKDGDTVGLDDFGLLELLSKVSGMEIPASLNALKNAEKRFEGVCDKTELLDTVSNFIKG